ncbi:MAG TPA: hypothetical protein VJK30_00565 [Coxiellaceae bacterium]|nr:MAG: hypothetical protein A3E81_08160 [Gammaproteobacteria bacterium RIFCSPHIGHO2_12_FULL_36_30]HLB55810.1 hypothetical protein [Coxiellaceae bacterium]
MRDYAKKSQRKKVRQESDGAWILVVLILCSVLFACYVTYHFTHETFFTMKDKITAHVKTVAHHAKVVEHKKPEKYAEKRDIKKTIPEKVAVKKEKTVAINPVTTQPKYDFYRILPAMRVTIPEPSK